MSLVADLLSKVKPSGRKGDVPPSLKKVVSDLSDKKTIRKKIIIYSILSLVAIIGGIGTVVFIDVYVAPKTDPKTSLASTAELKKRARERQASQAAAQKQKKDKVKKDEAKEEKSKKIVVASKPPAIKKEEISKKKEQVPEVARKEPEKTSKEQPKKVEKEIEKEQRIEVEKDEEIEEIYEPEDIEDYEEEEQEPQETGPPVNKDLHLYLAKNYENQKDYSKAFDSYKQVLRADPNNYLIMNNISSVLLHLGSFEESIEYSEMALSIKREYVPSLINLGIAYIKSGNLTAGEGYLLKVLSLQPSNKHVLFNIALMYEKIGQFDRASESYQRLSKMKDVQGYLGLARIAEKQNRISDAIIIYRELVSMKGIDPQVKRMAHDRAYMLQ